MFLSGKSGHRRLIKYKDWFKVEYLGNMTEKVMLLSTNLNAPYRRLCFLGSWTTRNPVTNLMGEVLKSFCLCC